MRSSCARSPQRGCALHVRVVALLPAVHLRAPAAPRGRDSCAPADLEKISRLRRAYRRQLGAQQPQCVAAVASRADAWARGRASASEVRGRGHSSSLACLLPAHALRHPPRKRSRAVPQATAPRPRRPADGARGQHGAARRGASCCGSNCMTRHARAAALRALRSRPSVRSCDLWLAPAQRARLSRPHLAVAPQELPGLSSWSGKPSAFRRQHGRAGRPRCVATAVLTGALQLWCVERAKARAGEAALPGTVEHSAAQAALQCKRLTAPSSTRVCKRTCACVRARASCLCAIL